MIGTSLAKDGKAQIALQQIISINESNVQLRSVLSELEETYNVNFFYSDQLVNAKQRVNVVARQKKLGDVLKDLFDPLNLTFESVNGVIVIKNSGKIEAAADIAVTGRVVEEKTGQPLTGVTVKIKGTTIAVATDIDGFYKITVPNAETVLVFSFLGYDDAERKVGTTRNINVTLKEKLSNLDEVIIVGFGQQKKESVVGAISQVSGKILERTGGVTSLGAALTGNIPGLVTTATTGMPGEENPTILIRGQTSWNNSAPLVLIDNIKRSINDIDINSVATISVLKDASATAIFGVEGANGVILITTKRGQEGSAKVDVNLNVTGKTVSKLPNKYDAYDALRLKNKIVEYELSTVPGVWSFITPQDIINKYRNQTTQEQRERYPNIDWQDYLFRDYALSTNPNVNISGGSKFVKYFANVDYVHEGDLFKTMDVGRGYTPKFEYNRLNSRTNFDFQLSKSTSLKVNLSGSNGVRTSPGGVGADNVTNLMSGVYFMAGDVFYPRYSDGSWGYFPPAEVETPNPAKELATAGVRDRVDTRLYTDFSLDQDLGFITKGLKFRGTLAWDYNFRENGRGIADGADGFRKYIDPLTGTPTYKYLLDANTNFDWMPSLTWSSQGGSMDDGFTSRNLNYQMQLNYATTVLKKHNVTLMGTFLRRENAGGGGIPGYREDWVFRTTYNYAGKYLLEYNGAYNGSERFAPQYRFGFFQSGAIGWLISEEKFIKENAKWIDMLKVKGSYGQIGDDSGSRWLYMDIWASGGNTALGIFPGAGETSPYPWLRRTQIGNPNVKWETVTKKNVGLEFSIFKGLISGSVDVFEDYRTNILIAGGQRAMPSYFGVTPPTSNLGRVRAKGYEIELRFSKNVSKSTRVWMNANLTYAKDRIEFADDPALRQGFLNRAGYANGQATSYISNGNYNTWDQVYGATPYVNSDSKIPGGMFIVDFDGDGVIDFDQVPYGYSGNPQHTLSMSFGVDWKGFSGFFQLYGVNNVSRYVNQESFTRTYRNTAYDVGSYWSKTNTNADAQMPRLYSYPHVSYLGDQFMYDGSYIRLKNAEIAYTFNNGLIKKIGINSLRMFLNGNNLWMWSRMPDDRESNTAGGTTVNNAYPTVRRFNLGMRISL
ncbi:TonB-dependent receptor [Mucilaginibacter auburnensis]|nr:TonB-dependent receptor [Mucilaginibacter auburnensis]